jgi:DNA repair exonuclease SbcCD nuclease subunit
VALGHIHQYYTREGWVYNPGSLETWNAGEIDWERGFLHVSVDSSSEQKHIAQLVQPPRRPFIRRHLDVEPCTSPLNLMELLRRSAAEWARAFHKSESDEPPDPGSAGSLPARPLGGGPPALPATGVAQPRPTGEPLTLLDARPVVHITLDGRLRFDRKDLDLGALEREIVEILQPLVVRIQDKTDETAFQVQTARGGDTLDRGALEFEILRQLFANDERRVHQATAWARLAQSLKQGALSKEDPARLVELVRREFQAITPTEKPPDPE